MKNIALVSSALIASAALGVGGYHLAKWYEHRDSSISPVGTEIQSETDGAMDGATRPTDRLATSASDEEESFDFSVFEKLTAPSLSQEALFLNQFVGLWQQPEMTAQVMFNEMQTLTIFMKSSVTTLYEGAPESYTTVCIVAPLDEKASIMNGDRMLLPTRIAVKTQMYGEVVQNETAEGTLLIRNGATNANQTQLMISINDGEFLTWNYLRDVTQREADVTALDCRAMPNDSENTEDRRIADGDAQRAASDEEFGEYTIENLRNDLNRREFITPETILSKEEFEDYGKALTAEYGRLGWLAWWDTEVYGWPVQYLDSGGQVTMVDHNQVIDSILEQEAHE